MFQKLPEDFFEESSSIFVAVLQFLTSVSCCSCFDGSRIIRLWSKGTIQEVSWGKSTVDDGPVQRATLSYAVENEIIVSWVKPALHTGA